MIRVIYFEKVPFCIIDRHYYYAYVYGLSH